MMRYSLPIVAMVVLSIGQLSSAQTALENRRLEPTHVNAGRTALDDYVAAPDDTYSWKILSKQSAGGMTAYIIDLKSQTWLTEDEVNRTVWQHWLTVVKPDGAKADTGMMFINGGSNGKAPPKTPNPIAMQVALATQSVVATVSMIPNQPLVFHQDGTQRVEDDLIGYTWDQYLKTGDDMWPARLPMTKAVVRAMDAVQELSATEEFGGPKVESFVVAGGSKRGWTTWTTAVVDTRVKAIAPIVIDVLNANVSMQHHYSAYGFWAPAIGDYVRHKIVHRRFEPRYQELLQLVDPFAYRDRLALPKCIINATGDQFFLPDSSQFYFDDLVGEKHLCYVPNGDHSLDNTNAIDTLAAFHYAIVHDVRRPEFSWDFPSVNEIRVQPVTKPTKVLLWQATNPKDRDFRVDTIGRAYKEQELDRVSGDTFVAKVEEPTAGWTAFFVQLEFDVGAPKPIRFSTPVRVIPELLPFADKMAPISSAAE